MRLDGFHSDVIYGRPFVSKLRHDIRAVFPTYTCVLSCLVGFFYSQVYDHFLTNAHIYALQTSMWLVYGVIEGRRIRGTELYRHQKAPLCTMDLKSNFSLNQAWPTAALISRFPDNGFVGIRGLSLERLTVRYFTNADRNNDRFS